MKADPLHQDTAKEQAAYPAVHVRIQLLEAYVKVDLGSLCQGPVHQDRVRIPTAPSLVG